MKTRFANGPKRIVDLTDNYLPLTVTSETQVAYVAHPGDHYTYILLDPLTDEICYAGKSTSRPANRLQEHYRDGQSSRKVKGLWIGSLIRLGMWPVMQVLQLFGRHQIDRAEQDLIWGLWDERHPLVNNAHLSPKTTEGYQEQLQAAQWVQSRRLSGKLSELIGHGK